MNPTPEQALEVLKEIYPSLDFNLAFQMSVDSFVPRQVLCVGDTKLFYFPSPTVSYSWTNQLKGAVERHIRYLKPSIDSLCQALEKV